MEKEKKLSHLFVVFLFLLCPFVVHKAQGGDEAPALRIDAGSSRRINALLDGAQSYMDKNDYDSALVHLHQARDLAKGAKDPELVLETRLRLVEYYRALAKFDQCERELEKVAGSIDTTQVSDSLQAYYLNRYAAYLNETTPQNEKKQVIELSRKAIRLAEKADAKLLVASSINEIGFAYENLRDPRALELYLKGYKIRKREQNWRAAANSLKNVVRECFRRKAFQKGIKYADQGLSIAKEHGYIQLSKDFYEYLLQIHERLGDHKKALRYYRLYHDTYEKVQRAKWNRSIVKIEREYDLDQQKEKTEKERLKAELAVKKANKSNQQRNYLAAIALILAVSASFILLLLRKNRKQNKLLKRSLEEKETLLREVYHRVKNNLTFLNSLLYLRGKDSEDEKVQDILGECRSRIHSMALVHQQLYEMKELSELDLGQFCQQLFKEIKQALEVRNFEYSVTGSIELPDLNRSLQVGLVLHELVMNAVEHSKSEEELFLGVELEEHEKKSVIRFFDNGQGLPEDMDVEKGGNFGLRLIQLLMKQLDSRLSYYRSNGHSYFEFSLANE